MQKLIRATRHRSQDTGLKLRTFLALCFLVYYLQLAACSLSFAQDSDLEFTIDANAQTIPLPPIFKPAMDLSGRGFHQQATWPQGVAAPEAILVWKKEIGFNGIFRLQYNLWEIHQLAKSKDLQDRLLNNYESIIKTINDSGGIAILSVFGTPAGMGRVLDSKSPPRDIRAFKAMVKRHMRRWSCEKKYQVWYEAWSAPDLDAFFLGRKQDYFATYRVIAEAAKELEEETKVHIPVGGPSSSWWFQNLEGNNIVIPERSLIYELIKFCYRYRLPLDFITWHGYSSDPKADRENTIYKKTAVTLIRNWLSYFNFDKNTPLIVTEWNFDRGGNVLLERSDAAYVAASYIPARLKNMYEAGINYQSFFCLEDFQNNKEGVNRNVGILWFDPMSDEYKGSAKAPYNMFRMLASLHNGLIALPSKPEEEFTGIIATKSAKSEIAVLLYSYIDPDVFRNYLSRNIGALSRSSRKVLLNLIRSGRLDKIMQRELDIKRVRASKQLKNLLKAALALNDLANSQKTSARTVLLRVKNLKENYIYQRYTIDPECSRDCAFLPAEEKETGNIEALTEKLTIQPYSVHMIVLKKAPRALRPEASHTPDAGQDAAATGQPVQ